MLPACFTLCFAAMLLTGCQSAFVEAVVRNDSAEAVSLIEVDYPSASFGRAALPAHTDFHYRFKILGSGPTRVQWTDSGHHEHIVSGPALREGQQGTLRITIEDATVRWEPQLH